MPVFDIIVNQLSVEDSGTEQLDQCMKFNYSLSRKVPLRYKIIAVGFVRKYSLDELNEKLRDKSGRIAYLIGLLIICISEVAFSILGKAGVISDHKVIVMYLFGLLLIQIVIGNVAYRQLRKKY